MTTDYNYKTGLDSIVLMRLGDVEWASGAIGTYQGSIVVKGKDPGYSIRISLVISEASVDYYVNDDTLLTTGSQLNYAHTQVTGPSPRFVLFKGEQAKERYDVINKSVQERVAKHFIEKLGDPDAMKEERERASEEQARYGLGHPVTGKAYTLDPYFTTTTWSSEYWKKLDNFWGKK